MTTNSLSNRNSYQIRNVCSLPTLVSRQTEASSFAGFLLQLNLDVLRLLCSVHNHGDLETRLH